MKNSWLNGMSLQRLNKFQCFERDFLYCYIIIAWYADPVGKWVWLVVTQG